MGELRDQEWGCCRQWGDLPPTQKEVGIPEGPQSSQTAEERGRVSLHRVAQAFGFGTGAPVGAGGTPLGNEPVPAMVFQSVGPGAWQGKRKEGDLASRIR